MSYHDDKAFERLEEKYHKILDKLKSARDDFKVIGDWGLSESVDAGDCRYNVKSINKLLEELGESEEE